MKIFTSLNCPLCKTPFEPTTNQPRSPRSLYCGAVICNQCFEKEESLKEEERKHQCALADACYMLPTEFAYYLIDVLSQEALTFSPMQLGYVLLKPFRIPECPICHDEYSIKIQKASFLLDCNHIICKTCYDKTRIYEGPHRAAYSYRGSYPLTPRFPYKYKVECPVCQTETKVATHKEMRKTQLEDFLTELPEITLQLEKMSTTKYRFCEECNKMDIVDEMFYCEDCQKKICGTCAVRKHSKESHRLLSLLETEATKLSDELQKLTANEIETYKGIFPEMHRELVEKIDTFKTKLLSKEGALKRAANFEDLKDKHEKCTKLKRDFETISKEYMPSLKKYMPSLRKYDTKVTELITRLDKDPY